MVGIDPLTGLPVELGIIDEIKSIDDKLYITERRIKKAKFITSIVGISDSKEADNLVKDLKKVLACGGTIKDSNTIELQGSHKRKVIDFLLQKGYKKEQIS